MGEPQRPIAPEQHLVTLGRILQTLREEENSDVLIETTLAYLKDAFAYDLVWIALYDRLEHRLFGKGGITPTGDTTVLKQRFPLTPGDLLEQVVIQQRPLGVVDLRAEPRAGELRNFTRTFNIQGTILFPLRYKDRCFGVVLLGTCHWGVSPRPEERARLSMVLGELASVLYQIETHWHHSQTKRPDESLFPLLEKLHATQNLAQRLEIAVEETHNFITPSRTNIYWFERERRYFWRRVSHQLSYTGLGENQQSAAGITVQEMSEFYDRLNQNQVVSIGEAHSSLKADITARLLQRIRARSLFAAPILLQDKLLGFLAVEAKESRIWVEEEKNYVKAVAELIAMLAPLESMELTIQEIQADVELTTQVARSVYSEQDWQDTLRKSAQQLLNRLSAQRFFVLQYDYDSGMFEVLYQTQLANRRVPAPAFSSVSDVDWQMLQTTGKTIAIENVEQDLRLVNWRPTLLDLGVRSLLVCNTSSHRPPEALILIAQETPRSWTTTEGELLHVVSQQLGLILRQWRLHNQGEQQKKILQALQWGLTSMQQPEHNRQSEQIVLQHIATVTNCPLAVLLNWLPGEKEAKIAAFMVNSSKFAVQVGATLSIETEALIRWSISAEGVLPLSVDDLPAASRQWLSGSEIGQILVMALHTSAEQEPSGIVLVADHQGRQWSEQCLDALTTLVYQLAWSRNYLQLTKTLLSSTEKLKQLNWYKHRRLEEIQRNLSSIVSSLNELGTPREALTDMRYQQLLRQLDNTSVSMLQIVKEEQWQLHTHCEVTPLATVLKRSLERVDKLVKQRKLWLGVNGLGDSSIEQPRKLSITGDTVKIELVLYEILSAACHRSNEQGRIDIWCRPLDQRSVEISITDTGIIDPLLLIDLQNPDHTKNILTTSHTHQPPGLYLLICQKIMQQIGGELHFSQLEDGRVLSRLLLPLG